MKIISIVGTRPQWMKLDKKLPQKIIVTGQHFDKNMKDVFFKGLQLPTPDYECHATELTDMLVKITKILKKEKPKLVVVYGDCRSTLAGALAASDLNIPIAHVEAGMRAFRSDMPEERIRVAVDHMSTILFPPNEEAAENLFNEGIRKNVVVSGNVMFDTFNDICPIKKGKDYKKFIYLSIHRQENTESKVRLESIFEGIKGKEKVIFPLHPRTRKALETFAVEVPKNVKIIDPVSYKENVQLISDARRVLTDSGGVQNEAYWMGVPCGLLRRETEWKEAVQDGWTKLLDADAIEIENFLKEKFMLSTPRPNMPIYGAKQIIREALLTYAQT